eukprot:12357133-Alexandrium_andersonii.AAC.1
MFPNPAGSFPDLKTAAAVAKSTTKKEQRRQAALQPVKNVFADVAKAKGGAPAVGGSTSSGSGGPAAPA